MRAALSDGVAHLGAETLVRANKQLKKFLGSEGSLRIPRLALLELHGLVDDLGFVLEVSLEDSTRTVDRLRHRRNALTS